MDLDHLHPDYFPKKPPDLIGGAHSFWEGEWVYAPNYGGDPCWLPGQVVDVTGPRSYRVPLEDGRTWRRHMDQLWRRRLPPLETITSEALPGPITPETAGDKIVKDKQLPEFQSGNERAADLPFVR